MRFIENNEKFGIKYDLNVIRKMYNKLKIPSEFDFIDFTRFEDAKYIIDMSERSLGKTTNYILLGMIFNKLYSTQICYIRDSADMIKPSICDELLNVILNFNSGFYINQLTDGKYTSIYYHWKKLYYCNYDEKGKRTDTASEPFLYFLSTDEHETYKSTLNLTRGDFIIYDEFIGRFYNFNSCYRFMDLLSTIIRQRKSPFIVMLANNISINSPWFEELTISKDVRKIKKGQTINTQTKEGTTFSIRLMDNPKRQEKLKHNKLFFGFNNPKLNSITGEGDWAVSEVQHIPSKIEKEKIDSYYFIRNAPNEFLRLEFCQYQCRICLFVTRATRVQEKDIVFTLKDRFEFTNGFFALGSPKFEHAIKKLMKQNDIFYGTNEVGADFLSYVNQCFNYQRYL